VLEIYPKALHDLGRSCEKLPTDDAVAPLDKLDIKILAHLQNDAGASVGEVAETVNLSVNAVWRRIKRLEADGVIRKRVALLDAEKLGLGLTVFVTVRAAEHTEEWLERFATGVHAIPEVVEFYRMSGEVDYLLKIVVGDVPHYDRVYKKLIKVAKLSDVSSTFAMEAIKHTTAVPIHSSDRF
jgi:Lrp/AsnC family transcriptional regulator